MTDLRHVRLLRLVSLSILFLIVAIGLPSAGHVLAQDSDESLVRMRPRPLPNHMLAPIIRGVPGVSQAYFRDGRPKLLNFFGSWCAPCVAENPHLMRLSRSGVIIIGVAVNDTQKGLANFITRYGNPFLRIGNDVGLHFSDVMRVTGYPTTFIVDGEGFVRFRFDGDLDYEDVPDVYRAVMSLY